MDELVKAIKLEMWLRKDYLHDQHIQTIYFGGGTPSLLKAQQLEDIIRACKTVFNVDDQAEITMEANPDDLNPEYLKTIQQIGVNRISIGIQSLSQSDLKLMKRRHNPIQAKNAVKFAREAGFKNISVDLIYGVPHMSFEQWHENLNQIFDMKVEHVSAYHLTYHQNTSLWADLQKGIISEIAENESLQQFDELVNTARKYGFIHYEISNFAKPGFFSQHNSSYWNKTEYLGLGPSAHSYDKNSRQWNVSSLTHYLLALNHQKIPFEKEELSEKDRFNEYMITSLRTMWGIDLNLVKKEFGNTFLNHLKIIGEKYLKTNQVLVDDNTIRLARNGLFVSDTIMTDFML